MIIEQSGRVAAVGRRAGRLGLLARGALLLAPAHLLLVLLVGLDARPAASWPASIFWLVKNTPTTTAASTSRPSSDM